MVTLNGKIAKRKAEDLQTDLVELFWEMNVLPLTPSVARQLCDQVYVLCLQRIGQAMKEALEDKEEDDEDAKARMAWEGCPHGDVCE